MDLLADDNLIREERKKAKGKKGKCIGSFMFIQKTKVNILEYQVQICAQEVLAHQMEDILHLDLEILHLILEEELQVFFEYSYLLYKVVDIETVHITRTLIRALKITIVRISFCLRVVADQHLPKIEKIPELPKPVAPAAPPVQNLLDFDADNDFSEFIGVPTSNMNSGNAAFPN